MYNIRNALILSNVAVTIALALAPTEFSSEAVYMLGFAPSQLIGIDPVLPAPYSLPWMVTLFTYQFIHEDIVHLLFNMLFLWGFGAAVEQRIGGKRFLAFYLMCGIAAGLIFALAGHATSYSLIGASGAISGVLGAFLVLYPNTQISIWLVFSSINIRALWFLLGWFILQFVNLAREEAGDQIAWSAHIGGFVTGIIVIYFFVRETGKK